jgi:diphthamide biosynthesis methyltransferase
MLFLVGLGLADERDITVKGLEIVKKAERVYLEAYTAVLLVEKEVLVSTRLNDRMQTDANCHGSRKLSMAVKSS